MKQGESLTQKPVSLGGSGGSEVFHLPAINKGPDPALKVIPVLDDAESSKYTGTPGNLDGLQVPLSWWILPKNSR
jgi:hypothetical protein